MKVIFLGTGPTKPVIRATEKRTNSSVLVDSILIDCTPMFLQQVKRQNITPDNINAILITHAHKDAIKGLNDLDKWINKEINIYSAPRVDLHRFVKTFKNLKIKNILPYKKYKILKFSVTPFRVIHFEFHPTLGTKFPTYGYKINDLVYAEDMEKIPKKSEKYFKNVNTIIADGAMWFGRQIRGHLSTDKTLELAKKFNPKNLIIIQAGRTYPNQDEAEKQINSYWKKIKENSKSNILLSYDGMIFDTMKSELAISKRRGIYLKKPHAEMIWSGEKKLIVKSEDYKNMINIPLFFLDNKNAYGILILSPPKEIDLEQFEKLEVDHKITEEERKEWWPNKDKFYAYTFEIIDTFETPKPVSVKSGTQTFISEVQFLTKEENSFFEDYDEATEELFASPGGKTRIVKSLLKLMPEHETYIEPFAGGAALYWKKEPSKLDILNDSNTEIAYAYKFMKEASDKDLEFLKQFNWNASKELFFKLRDTEAPRDPVARFYRFYYVLFHSYGASCKTFGYKKQKVNIFNKIPQLRDRLKDTKIYNEDYTKILKKYNSQNTFAYLDPPYPEEWPGPEGINAFTKDDIKKLHNILKNFKGKFLLSINNLDWIRETFEDFNISKIKVPRSFRHNDSPKYELLIANYEIPKIITENLEATSSGDIAGMPSEIGGLQPVYYEKEDIELIKDLENYDPVKLLNEQLADDWRIVNAWYSKYIETEGKGIKFSKETIVNTAKLIYDEIVKRVKKGEMKHEFQPENMKPHSLELYKIVSKKNMLSADWSDLKFIDNFNDFIVIKDCISLIGSSVTQEHKPNDIDLLIRFNEPENKFLKRAVEVRISKMLPQDLQDKLHFVWGEKEGPHDNFIPLFDLQFKKIKPTKLVIMAKNKVELLKPFLPMKPFGSALYDLDKLLDILK